MSKIDIIIYDELEIVSSIREFFGDNENLIIRFNALMSRAQCINPKLKFRKKEDIIGISEPNVMFVFYVSNKDGEYYIKFKNQQDKLILETNKMEILERFCDENVELLKDNPQYIIGATKNQANNVADEPISDDIDDNVIADCNEALSKCRDFFSNSEYNISDVFKDRRTINALSEAQINKCAQLAGVTAQDLMNIRNLGKSSLKRITDTCLILCSNDFEVEKARLVCETKENPWSNLREKTSKSIFSTFGSLYKYQNMIK